MKISPKKCKLFKTKLVYMGCQLLIDNKNPKVTPMKSRVEAILKLNPPKHLKVVHSFVEW